MSDVHFAAEPTGTPIHSAPPAESADARHVPHHHTQKHQAVFVDVDGTLIDSYPGVTHSYLTALAAVGVTHPAKRPLRTILGPPMVESFRTAGVPEDLIPVAQRAYLTTYGSTGWSQYSVYPGAREFLMTQRAQGRTLATATSKGDFFTRKVLEHAGLLEFFDVVATAGVPGVREFPTKACVIGDAMNQVYALWECDTLGVARPADRPASGPQQTGENAPQLPGKHTGWRPNFVHVGDRSHDYEGAGHHGIAAIAATWGYGDSAEWSQASAVAHDFADAGRKIDELFDSSL